MTHQKNISTYIISLAISLLALASVPTTARAQKDGGEAKKDTTAFFKGFAVFADLIGPAQMMFGDYGQYEAGLRINLKDKYFPTVELGYGKADHNDDATNISYKTSAPYARIGIDFNVLKNKHDIYRLFAGVRYAFTSFKYDLSHPGMTDPVWGDTAPYEANGVKCSYQWVEAVIGVDAKMWGPVHLGWSLRYRSRVSHNDGPLGNSWYVPGYGKTGGSNIGGTFNVTVDI